MKKTTVLLAGVAAVALSAGMAHAQTPTIGQLAQRVEALEAELQAAEMRQADDRNAVAAVSSQTGGWWDNTKISGRMYWNITSINHETNGVRTGVDNGVSFDIKRFYVGIDHTFNSTFAANVTTDFEYDSGAGATQIYIKKAYLEAKLDEAFNVRVGATDLPWVPFVEGLYGNRFIEKVMVDRTKFGTSADWGVHVSGKLAGGVINYAVAALTGSGYKKANTFRTNNVDFEGRVNAVYNGFTVGVGGYVGKLGAQFGTATPHTAQRFNAVAAYSGSGVNVGFEYFTAENWANVKTVATDGSEGYSFWGAYRFDPMWSVFGRYEWVNPKTTTAPTLEDTYFNVGITYSPATIVDLSLVYKRDEAVNGTISTANGTIGGATNGTFDEVGIFGRLRW